MRFLNISLDLSLSLIYCAIQFTSADLSVSLVIIVTSKKRTESRQTDRQTLQNAHCQVSDARMHFRFRSFSVVCSLLSHYRESEREQETESASIWFWSVCATTEFDRTAVLSLFSQGPRLSGSFQAHSRDCHLATALCEILCLLLQSRCQLSIDTIIAPLHMTRYTHVSHLISDFSISRLLNVLTICRLLILSQNLFLQQ